jgi:hypothetical protein
VNLGNLDKDVVKMRQACAILLFIFVIKERVLTFNEILRYKYKVNLSIDHVNGVCELVYLSNC